MESPEEKDLDLDKELKSIRKAFSRQLKRSQKQLEKCHDELSQCQRWEEIQHEAELLQSRYPQIKRGMPHITVWDWVTESDKIIALDPRFTPKEEITSRFKRSKKLRKGIPYVEAHLKKVQENIVQIHDWMAQLDLIAGWDHLNQWREHIPLAKPAAPQQKKESSKPKERLPYYEYTSPTGMKILVGRTARDNEKLTFSIAKGSDWWLHAADVPGSHVIIRTIKGAEPDPETLREAVQLALRYSKAKGEGEVCVTQCKYVSRFGRGHVGKVQISKHKKIKAKS